MKYYIKAISYTQKILLGLGILTLMTLPLAILYNVEAITSKSVLLYDIVHITVFFVMVIRPLADILTGNPYIRPLVILRKGFGVVSASIVVSFLLAKILETPDGYLFSIFTADYWSLVHYALLAHLADITAVLLLITSNRFSKRILGAWWKRIQRLSYVYFFASSLYVYLSFGETLVLVFVAIVTFLTIVAFIKNLSKVNALPKTV
jgi:DMSO/TMAO reductase YedYZ heme-binding membrane subunit